jgi:hypothetical protein
MEAMSRQVTTRSFFFEVLNVISVPSEILHFFKNVSIYTMVDMGGYKQDKILTEALHYIFIMFLKLEIPEVSPFGYAATWGYKSQVKL